MIDVAEFAYSIHTKERNTARKRNLVAQHYPAQRDKLDDIRIVIFDVYGTLVNYYCPEFETNESKKTYLCRAFQMTAEYFGFTPYLVKMDATALPCNTLYDLYHGLILLNHEKNLKKGITFPEIRIEEIWEVIIMMLNRHGYTPLPSLHVVSKREFAKCVAFYYNFHVLGRGLYPGVVDTLIKLKAKNILLGIASDGQFYTPIDMTLFIRDQSNEANTDYRELFEHDLVLFSYEYGVTKPNQIIFRKLFDILYGYSVLPSQVVFIGNDLIHDIKTAQEAGMKTAFFTGDEKSFFIHDRSKSIIPDIAFSTWPELVEKISFFEEHNHGPKEMYE
ncbi:MAG: HAD family hydrolase [Chitinivibrionales bacterium]|nr:HAD family hydrolase [Chitinivibrionales bacterium]